MLLGSKILRQTAVSTIEVSSVTVWFLQMLKKKKKKTERQNDWSDNLIFTECQNSKKIKAPREVFCKLES